MNHYHHLSPEERAVIMLGREQGLSLRRIAAKLGRSPSTLSRELARNDANRRRGYDARDAGEAYRNRRKHCVRPRKLIANPELCWLVEDTLLKLKWSPEQIAAILRKNFPGRPEMTVSPETIYAHIYAYPKGELRKLLRQSLRRGKSKRGPRGSKESNYSSLKIAPEQLIANRPEEINSRAVAGHWEGDLIVGAMNQSCVGTLVERKLGFVILAKMQSKSAPDVRQGFEEKMKNLPDFLRRSLTYDRGAELAEHPLLTENLNLTIYFADQKAPWQRGSSENINGLIRQFLPKGQDLSRYSQAQLDQVAWLLNTRPRKRFNFQSPQELMEQELKNGGPNVALDN